MKASRQNIYPQLVLSIVVPRAGGHRFAVGLYLLFLFAHSSNNLTAAPPDGIAEQIGEDSENSLPSEQKSESSQPTWVADASRTAYPDVPAMGRLEGKPFTVDLAQIVPWHETSGTVGDPPEKMDRVDGAVLTLQAGTDPQPRDYFTIFVVVPTGETLEDKEFLVREGGLFKQTRRIMDKDGKGWFYPVGGVQVNSAEPGQASRTQLIPKITMRLKFNKRVKDQLQGMVYLCVDDADKSFVAGSFNALVKEEGAALPMSKYENAGEKEPAELNRNKTRPK